jgi:hypothetical protein
MKAQDNVLNRNMKAQQFAQNQQNKLRSPP